MIVKRLSHASTLLLAFASVLNCQTAGKLIGQVTDPSQSSVPDAKVTAANTSTGQVRTVNTDNRGTYSITDLPIGTYNVTVVHEAFTTVQKSNIQITVAQTATLNFEVQPGVVSQRVEVQATAEAVDVQPGETLTNSQVENLPSTAGISHDLRSRLPAR